LFSGIIHKQLRSALGNVHTGKTQEISAAEMDLILTFPSFRSGPRRAFLYEVRRGAGKPFFQVCVHPLNGGASIPSIAARTPGSTVQHHGLRAICRRHGKQAGIQNPKTGNNVATIRIVASAAMNVDLGRSRHGLQKLARVESAQSQGA
jgi:hypothetical protein